MKPASLILFFGSCAAQASVDYFLQFTGGNPTIDGQRMRLNTSIQISPGVSAGPYNPADHFCRFHINETSGSELLVIPTNPHPPPVPGYLALNGDDHISDAYRLVETWNPGQGVILYHDWKVLTNCNARRLLRYGELSGEGRWIAVPETTSQGVRRWVPWWVKFTDANMDVLADWDYDVVDVELVQAKGPVNSNAPGGVEE